MKNLSIPGILLLLVTIATSCSQNLVPPTTKPDALVLPGTEEVIEPVSKNEVSTKVVKVFYKSYGEQQSPNWYRSSKGFGVTFENDGVKTLVRYTAAGMEESRTRFYFEKNLVSEVRNTVRSNFYDYTILYVTEVQKNDITVFYIKMQDSKTIKTIRMVNGEWEEIENLARL